MDHIIWIWYDWIKLKSNFDPLCHVLLEFRTIQTFNSIFYIKKKKKKKKNKQTSIAHGECHHAHEMRQCLDKGPSFSPSQWLIIVPNYCYKVDFIQLCVGFIMCQIFLYFSN